MNVAALLKAQPSLELTKMLELSEDLLHYNYRPQRSCGQGNIFTPVCHSVHREGSASVHGGIPPPPSGADTPPGTKHPPGADPPPPTGPSTPLGKQTPAYGLRAAGTHPTGMHTCCFVYFANLEIKINSTKGTKQQKEIPS